MGKIKNTKNELKAQRDALKRFERFLPTLQLKKIQLQVEVRQLEARIEEKKAEEEHLWQQLGAWQKLFAEPFDFDAYVQLETVTLGIGNIAGVEIPVLDGVKFKTAVPDLFATPAWVDDGIKVLEHLVRLRAEQLVMHEQERCLREELRTTNQRVNLFEKVKIPQCKENIRMVRIFLGDQDTAAVARAKIAKKKTVERH